MNIRAYNPDDLRAVVDVFRSNIPKYFTTAEEQGLRSFLHDARAEDYYLIEINREVVGCGGIALNDDNTVSLCWGMVRADHPGTGLGKKLTEFRIQKASEKFGGMPLVISTSQHTEGFYEKFGFRTIELILDGFGRGLHNCKMRLDHLPSDNANGRE